MMAAGAVRYNSANERHEANPLGQFRAGEYVDVKGKLLKSPARDRERDVLTIQVRSVRAAGQETQAEGLIRVNVPFKIGSRQRLMLNKGDSVEASLKFSGPAGFRNFRAFSYDLYLKGLGIHRRAYTKSSLLVNKTSSASIFRPSVFFSRLRTKFQQALEFHFPSAAGTDISPAGAVLEAILLGEDGRMSQEHVLMLQKSGLYHLFAISGGHIAIIAWLIYSLLKILGAGPRRRILCLGIFLVFYTMLVEAGPTVMRAVIMAEIMITGKLLFRQVDLVNSISFSAFILLLANPFSIFDAGFQLTYTATLAIILFAPPLQKILPRLPLGISALGAMSAAAFLAVSPIIARSFNRMTTASLILNFAAVPLTSLIMGLGYVFLIAAPFLGANAAPLARLLELLTAAFVRIGGLLDPLAFFSYRVPTPKAWVFWGYYFFFILIPARQRFRGQRAFIMSAFAVFLALLMIFPFSPSSKELKVTMLDVGQGDSFLVEFPGRTRMLIDGGGIAGSSFDVGENVVCPFLWSKGFKKLDIVVLTHAHPDHAAGLEAVLRNFKTAEVWESGLNPDDPVYEKFRSAINPGIRVTHVRTGFQRPVGEVLIEALGPEKSPRPGQISDLNETSVVLRLTSGQRSFLFTGDIGRTTELSLLDSGRDIRSSVLKVPHHGSGRSSSAEFIEAVGPEVALVPVGTGNAYGFPSARVLDDLSRAGTAVFRSDLDGSVEVSTDGKGLRLRTRFLLLLIDTND